MQPRPDLVPAEEHDAEKARFQEEKLAIQLQLENLEKGLKDRDVPLLLPEMEVSGRAITVYRNKIAQLQLQINEMSTQYTAEFEPRKALNKEETMVDPIRTVRSAGYSLDMDA